MRHFSAERILYLEKKDLPAILLLPGEEHLSISSKNTLKNSNIVLISSLK